MLLDVFTLHRLKQIISAVDKSQFRMELFMEFRLESSVIRLVKLLVTLLIFTLTLCRLLHLRT